MKKLISAFLLVFALAMPVFGQDKPTDYVIPPLVVQGVDNPTPYGELVDLTIVDFKPSEDLVSIQYSWKVLAPDANGSYSDKKKVRVSADHKNVVFAAGLQRTEILAIVNGAYTFVKKDKDGKILAVTTVQSDMTVVRINVGAGPLPPPGPGPGPTPPPGPVTPPDGKFKLAKVALDNLSLVNSPTKVAVAKALASSYRKVATDIAGGKVADLGAAYKALKEGNQAALVGAGGSVEDWQNWDNTVRKQVYSLYLNKQLPNLTDYVDVFNEIASGLELAQ